MHSLTKNSNTIVSDKRPLLYQNLPYTTNNIDYRIVNNYNNKNLSTQQRINIRNELRTLQNNALNYNPLEPLNVHTINNIKNNQHDVKLSAFEIKTNRSNEKNSIDDKQSTSSASALLPPEQSNSLPTKIISKETKFSKMKLFYIFLVIIVAGLLVVVAILGQITNFEKEEKKIDFPGTQRDFLRHNCNVETVYAFTDSQCQLVCTEPGTFVVKNGTCVNLLSIKSEAIENKCDPKRGVFGVLIGDGDFGRTKMICLSVDPGIQPDNLEKPNDICTNGTIDEIDYLKTYPQMATCKCADDQILTFIPSTNQVRQRGYCAPKKAEKLYKLNDLLYPNNKL